MLIIEQDINKPVDTVFSFLSEMDKFVSVHPIIYKIDKIEENHFLIHEKLKIFVFSIGFTYPTLVIANKKDKTIQFKARINAFLNIDIFFNLTEAGNQTKLVETVVFKSILPIKSILSRIFIKQHKQLFLNIQKDPV